MARQTKKRVPVKPCVPRAVTRAVVRAQASAWKGVSAGPVAPGVENHPPISDVTQDPNPDAAAEITALQGEFSSYCA